MGKYIRQLPSAVAISDSDFLVIDDNSHNYKIPWSQMKALLPTVSRFETDPDTNNYPGYIKLTLTNGTTLRVKPSDPDKQDTLTFDNSPTAGSSNPVTSGGVFSALGLKLNASDYTLFHGATSEVPGDRGIVPGPAAGGLRYLGSDGVWHVVDNAPSEDSANLITSGAVYEAIQQGGGGGGEASLFYGVCNSAADAAAKIVAITGITQLSVGLAIRVLFTNAHTAATPVTLTLNNLGPVPMQRCGNTPVGKNEWAPQEALDLVYTGSVWMIVGTSHATVPESGSIDASGKISFKNRADVELFSVQLPLFSGGVE